MNGTEERATRESALRFALENFDTQPEYLWLSDPNFAVLRHACGKWYGIIMDVQKKKLGLNGTGKVDILVIKCEPALQYVLLRQRGFLPAYHMNKEHWISVLLDGSLTDGEVFPLIEASYEAAGSRKRSGRA